MTYGVLDVLDVCNTLVLTLSIIALSPLNTLPLIKSIFNGCNTLTLSVIENLELRSLPISLARFCISYSLKLYPLLRVVNDSKSLPNKYITKNNMTSLNIILNRKLKKNITNIHNRIKQYEETEIKLKSQLKPIRYPIIPPLIQPKSLIINEFNIPDNIDKFNEYNQTINRLNMTLDIPNFDKYMKNYKDLMKYYESISDYNNKYDKTISNIHQTNQIVKSLNKTVLMNSINPNINNVIHPIPPVVHFKDLVTYNSIVANKCNESISNLRLTNAKLNISLDRYIDHNIYIYDKLFNNMKYRIQHDIKVNKCIDNCNNNELNMLNDIYIIKESIDKFNYALNKVHKKYNLLKGQSCHLEKHSILHGHDESCDNQVLTSLLNV